MPTLLYTHPACVRHDTGEYHPECSERLRAILHVLDHQDFFYLLREQAPQVTTEQLLRAHSQAHIDHILSSVPTGDDIHEIDSDTFISRDSGEAALRAAGAVVAAVDEVATGRCRNAFCAVRPPGHHAEPSDAMGFCLFNNVAIGALHARAVYGFQRVAVLDFDVHHGNGTQRILWDVDGTFYGSTHQVDAFPYSGAPEETGGAGIVVNVPLAAGSGSETFREAWSATILPRLRQFEPDFLIISAGFDAHAADPIAHLRLHVSDFEWLTHELTAIARQSASNRLVSVLEGGYDLRALAACVAAHLRVLMGG